MSSICKSVVISEYDFGGYLIFFVSYEFACLVFLVGNYKIFIVARFNKLINSYQCTLYLLGLNIYDNVYNQAGRKKWYRFKQNNTVQACRQPYPIYEI